MINENMDVFLRARMTDFLDRINIYIARVDKENHKLQFVEDIEFWGHTLNSIDVLACLG